MTIGSAHGWGVCGKHLALELATLGPLRIVGESFDLATVGDALEFHALDALVLRRGQSALGTTRQSPLVLDGALLQGIGDERLLPRDMAVRGSKTIGYTFFERNLLQPAWVENGRRYFGSVVAGSSWCASVLWEAGLVDAKVAIQGVDHTAFHPPGSAGGERQFLQDKFVVFSGGKFEYRKGQDVVIRAYKTLQDRHADVLLVNAWWNPWPAIFDSMRSSPLIRFAPPRGRPQDVISGTLAENGIDLERVITCPRQLNSAMARIYRNTDVGLFPNRCEGGTNLVLMEYMACAKLVIATNTTGHAEIVTHANAQVIATKGEAEVKDESGVLVARWPEPDLDDVIDKLEWAYQHRDKLRALGQRACETLARFTWRKTAETFLGIIHEVAGAPE